MRMVLTLKACPFRSCDGNMAQLRAFRLHKRGRHHNAEIVAKNESEEGSARMPFARKEKLYPPIPNVQDFYAASVPVIVCDGKNRTMCTFQCAIKSLAATIPNLNQYCLAGRLL